MVTKKEQNQIIISPRDALLIVMLTIAIGVLVWVAAIAPREKGFSAYDELNPQHSIIRTDRHVNNDLHP